MTMRILIISLFTIFLSVPTFGQNGLKEGNYFILQKDKKTISLNTFENGELKEKESYSINEKSIYATDQKYKVAILDTSRNIISLFEIETSKQIDLTIPFDLKPKTIILNDDNLFVGGEMGKEMLIQYYFQTKKWYKLEIPVEVLLPGKAVDDLVLNDSLLIAIDNIVIPKYLLFYKLTSTGKLSYSHFKELKSNGTYESIYGGRITPKYLGLISGTFGGYGSSEHITIYNNLDLSGSFAISTDSDRKDYYTFNDFLIVGDKIIIASKEKGFGIFEIKPSYFHIKQDRPDIFNSTVNTNKIKYKHYKNQEIKRLSLIPDSSKIVLTISNKFGKIRHEIIDI